MKTCRYFVIAFLLITNVFAQKQKIINIDIIANNFLEAIEVGKYKFYISSATLDNKTIEIKFEQGQIMALEMPSGAKTGRDTPIPSTQELTTLELNQGDKVEFIISDRNDAKYRKSVVFQVPPRGKWNTTFGFSFIRDIFSIERAFYAVPTGKANEYKVVRGANPNKFFYAPSVFFSWLPTKKQNQNWTFSWTGGLGLQGNNATPTVFLGGSFFYNQNLGINFGIAAHQINFLKPEFKDEAVFISSTTPDIMTKAYRINPFLSVSLRFKDNPFNK